MRNIISKFNLAFSVDEKILILIVIIGLLAVSIFSLYDTVTYNPPESKPKPEVKEQTTSAYIISEHKYNGISYMDESSRYETINYEQVALERYNFAKELYSKGDYFGAREEFYTASDYGLKRADYWIRVCNAHIEDLRIHSE